MSGEDVILLQKINALASLNAEIIGRIEKSKNATMVSVIVNEMD
jgi:hypothetical protein